MTQPSPPSGAAATNASFDRGESLKPPGNGWRRRRLRRAGPAAALNGAKAASVMAGDSDGGISEFRAAIARYPGVRVFHQRAPGGWTPKFAGTATELPGFAGK